VTSLKRNECKPKYLFEKLYCARGEMENRIEECQLDLYADRTSTATMRANQLRLWFASMAYVLLCDHTASTTQAAAPSASSCSKSAHWCASVSAASKSRWGRAALPPPSGVLPRSASMLRQPRAVRRPDTRRRPRTRRHQPQAHRDQFFAAPAALEKFQLLAPLPVLRTRMIVL
jgi:Transposase DDE domain group 1